MAEQKVLQLGKRGQSST